MKKQTINDTELLRLLDEEKMSQAGIAKAFGVTRQAINQRVRELRGHQTKVVAAAKYDRSVDANFDAMSQLKSINDKALALLDDAESNPDLSLKCIAEIRQQIKLASEIYERMFNIKIVSEFMETVAATLKECDSNVYQNFKRKLNANRSFSGVIRLP